MIPVLSTPSGRGPRSSATQPPAGAGAGTVPVALLSLTLLATLPFPLEVPFVHVSLQNLAVPLGSLALAACLWPQRDRVWQVARPLLPATIALVAWSLAVSVLSEQPEVSFRYWVKYLVYLVVWAGFLFVFSVRSLHGAAYLTAYWFLVGLALMGVVEMAFPGSAVFRVFRTPESLLCRPRIASLLSSPNTYGALMVLGLALGERLRARGRLRGAVYVAGVFLLTVQVAQSGSRNAWLVLAGVLVWMLIRHMMSPLRAAGLAAGFAMALVVLPIPARQAGIEPPTFVPQAGFLLRKGDLQSVALCPAPVTFALRLALWREALTEFERRPLQGIGIGVFQRTGGLRVMGKEGFNAHNLPLAILVATGLVGFVLSGVWLASTLRRWPKASDIAEVAVVVLMGAQVADLFLHDYTYTTMAVLAWAGFLSPRWDA